MKKDAAETEKAWRGAGQDVGIKIWRIVKFKVGAATDCLLHDHIFDALVWSPRAGEGLAQGGVWEVLQRRLLHYPQHIQGG